VADARRIREAIREGRLSVNEIARLGAVTRRAVFAAKAQIRELSPEPDLFTPLSKREARR
jgi:hypothetical protein